MRLIIIDTEDRIILTNPAAERLFGYPHQDGRGADFAQEMGQPS